MSKASLFERISKHLDKEHQKSMAVRVGQPDYNLSEKRKDLNAAIEEMWKNTRPVIRTELSTFAPINKSGKFKTAFDVGNLAPWSQEAIENSRAAAENFMFGKLGKNEHPVYGYMEPVDKSALDEYALINWQSELNEYGPVKFYPKPEAVGGRSTFTVGDSEFDTGIPFRLDSEKNMQALDRKDRDETPNKVIYTGKTWADGRFDVNESARLNDIRRGLGGHGEILETQIFGGVPLTDIGRVDIPRNSFSEMGITRQQAIDYANKFGYNLNLTDSDETILECLANCPQ